MSIPRLPNDAKLIAGLLFAPGDVHTEALAALGEHFGALDLITEPIPFTYTDYYAAEMGPGLQRQLVSFVDLVRPETLPDIKQITNRLEDRFSRSNKRRINIDPGILTEERVVLATGKNYTHRIYLRDGIYADLTLIFQRGSYQGLPWTYPDYLDPLVLHFLAAIRLKLIHQQTGRLPHKGLESKEEPGAL